MDREDSLQNTSSELESSSQCSLVINESQVKLSKRRWLILGGVTIFGLLLTFANQTSPVLEVMLNVVGLKIDKMLYLDRLFAYQLAIIAIPTARYVDKYGIRLAMYFAATLFVVQAIFRCLMYNIHLPHWKDYRLSYYMGSNVIYIQILAIFICLPLKVSEIWFSESERSFAWTIMGSLNNISIALASYLYPKIILRLEDVKYLFYITTVCAITVIFSTVIMINKSKPKHPANTRVAIDPQRDRQPLKETLKRMSKQPDLGLHLIHAAVFDSIYATITSVVPDLLESSNRSEIFTGDLNSIFHMLSLVLGLITANFVHKVQNPTIICKTASFCQAVAFAAYMHLMLHPVPAWTLYAGSVVFAIAKAWTAPNYNNMTAHLACGTVSHATVVGVCITMSTLASTVIAIPFVYLIKVRTVKSDYTWAVTFMSTMCTLNAIVYCSLFRGRSIKQMEESTDREHDTQVSA